MKKSREAFSLILIANSVFNFDVLALADRALISVSSLRATNNLSEKYSNSVFMLPTKTFCAGSYGRSCSTMFPL